ncbi:hypothetical protein C943_02584 [Mariniradius saccharolyticus AK6]|uniref:Uncharacterized protein n=1 Tax=Mariniradius saccharolyticus AK6 TaxID=1239962 RepID=M7X821_9BACT|nr:hypothetical protein C943_02584 [Mariniradius saccharolyticus AK6]
MPILPRQTEKWAEPHQKGSNDFLSLYSNKCFPNILLIRGQSFQIKIGLATGEGSGVAADLTAA